jgi:hypothetical protein
LPVSAVDCIQPALQHAREQLFTRFRFGQWSRLALVGILAAELRSGGCNFNPAQFASHARNTERPFPWPGLLRGLPSFNPAHIPAHIGQFIGLIVAGIFVAVVLGFVFLYIHSVFRFILFGSVLRRECSIGDGWRKWHRAGGRFFLWQLVFQIAAGMFLLFLIGVPLAVAFALGWMQDLQQHVGRLVVGALFLVALFMVFVLTAAVVQVLARDFLVPIMALEDLDFADGWHRVLAIVRPEKGSFAIYLLLKFVLSLAAAILFGIIAIIPSLFVFVPAALVVVAGHAAGIGWNVTTISLAIIFGTMLLLLLIYLVALVCVPATVFFPAYALYFLAARYPNLDALLHPAAAAPAPELPPVPEPPPPFEAPPLPPEAEPIG